MVSLSSTLSSGKESSGTFASGVGCSRPPSPPKASPSIPSTLAISDCSLATSAEVFFLAIAISLVYSHTALGVEVIMQDCHSCDPGSIPGAGANNGKFATNAVWPRQTG